MKMEWGWVRDYPVFVYMQFIEQGSWNVKVVKGVKGNQHTGDTSPSAPAWFKYVGQGLVSRYDVFEDACKRAEEKLSEEGKNEMV